MRGPFLMGHRLALDVAVLWGDAVLRVERRLVDPRAPLTADALGIAETEGAPLDLSIPSGAQVARASMGPVTIELCRSETWQRSTRAIDAAPWLSHAASAALHALLLATTALGLIDRYGDDDQIAILRDLEVIPSRSDAIAPFDVPGASGHDQEDVAPHPQPPLVPKASAGSAPGRPGRPARAENTVAEAASFGMVGLLHELSVADAPEANAWARATEALDGVGESSTFGPGGIGDSLAGGIDVSGVGEGGGGRGEGIGLGSVGTIGTCRGRCVGGVPVGLERPARLSALGHQTKSPLVRCGGNPESTRTPCATTVTGRLPPEVIQRVVRQNHGRFRACYEAGLAKNPSLAGRVSIKFVIDGSGAVSAALDGGSDLPDSDVVACVVRSMASLSFPEPEGGIVTVVYPLLLASE